MTQADRIYLEAAGPQCYPAWLHIGRAGSLNGWQERLAAAFVPCTVPRPRAP
jgi:hypothetical protein